MVETDTNDKPTEDIKILKAYITLTWSRLLIHKAAIILGNYSVLLTIRSLSDVTFLKPDAVHVLAISEDKKSSYSCNMFIILKDALLWTIGTCWILFQEQMIFHNFQATMHSRQEWFGLIKLDVHWCRKLNKWFCECLVVVPCHEYFLMFWYIRLDNNLLLNRSRYEMILS
jgi:hypothetical protein